MITLMPSFKTLKILDTNGKSRDCDSVAPDPSFPGFVKVDFTSKIRTGYKHSEWYPTIEFLRLNPSLRELLKGAPQKAQDSLGNVTKATKNSLTDKAKKWSDNAYRGFPIWISRGRGESQTRKVVSNSPDTLVVDTNWVIVPDKSSQYLISYNIHNPKIMGNTLPIKPK